MSKPQRLRPIDTLIDKNPNERPILVLERQLINTIELSLRVQQARIRSNGTVSAKTRSLFEGMARELHSFTEMIRTRLEALKDGEVHASSPNANSFWRLFATDSFAAREQLEALLTGYARYSRQTSDALISLQRAGDVESSRLLSDIASRAHRCLWFLEIYLEGLALHTDSNRLPDWPANRKD